MIYRFFTKIVMQIYTKGLQKEISKNCRKNNNNNWKAYKKNRKQFA